MAVTLLKGHVSRALDFYNKSDIYLGLGKTTPWEEGESNPPTPLNTDSLVEIAGYKKVESKFLVIPDDTGTGELSFLPGSSSESMYGSELYPTDSR